MTKHKLCKIWGVAFLSVCIFACMLGGFVGIFETVDYSQQQFIADAATTIESYYAPLEDYLTLFGDDFRDILADLIGDNSTDVIDSIKGTHKNIVNYDSLRNHFLKTDADPTTPGNIIWFYTGDSVPFSSVFDKGDYPTNREHVWCQSLGGFGTSRAGADAHHIRPLNSGLNSTRNNRNFKEVTTNVAKQNGTTSYSNLCYFNTEYFYPGEGYRGATARILMYVQTRWGKEDGLKFVLGEGTNQAIGDIETLMKWHIEEPPTAEEIRRNNAVEDIQGNRNPFIDHPEYAEMIYCYDGESYNDELQAVVEKYGSYLDDTTDPNVDVESITLTSSKNTLIVGEKAVLTASIKPDNAIRDISWSSTNEGVASVNDGIITALSAGTTTITATSIKTPSVKATVIINVKALSAINITGTATKTNYTAGEKFNPAGLTVTATYSDLSTATIPNSQIQWLDATTKQEILAAGTASVIAKYGSIEKTITGINVKAPSNTIFTFGENGNAEHVDGSSINAKTYTQGSYSLSITNASSVYDGAFDAQGNSALKVGTNSKTGSFTFAVPNNVTSVVIYVAQYKANATSITVNGATHSITTSSNSGEYTPITVDTSANKTVNFATTSGGKRCMIDKIEFIVAADDSCNHISSDWIEDTPATCKVAGTKHKECTKCGETLETGTIPVSTTHTYGGWNTTSQPTCNAFGSKSHTCTVCGKTESEQIGKLSHNWSQWVDNGNGTHYRECSITTPAHKEIANHVDSNSDLLCDDCGSDMTPIDTSCQHQWGNWTDNGDGTCTRICSIDSNHSETSVHKDANSDEICDNCNTALHEHNHVAGVPVAPTCTEAGYTTYTCSCGDSYRITGADALGHTPSNAVVENNVAPDCENTGSYDRVIYCIVCEEELNRENISVDALGHTYGDWADNGDGTDSRVCSVCNDTETKERPLDLEKISDFEDAVDTLISASSLEAKWDAISDALSKYNLLTGNEKAAVNDAYAILAESIAEYNTTVNSINTQSNKATSDAINLFAGLYSILAVAAYLLLKK